MQLEGMWIGSCHILRRIGGGGMGDVYLAEQPALGRKVAVKVVRAEEWDAATGGHGQADAQLAQEARAIAALDHPHILPLYEFGELEQLRYLVMPYVERGSLADLLRQGEPWGWSAPLTPALALAVVEQTASALQAAHDQRVIHRDVKPGNLLVRLLARSSPASFAPGGVGDDEARAHLGPDDIHILLADFGLARTMTDSQPNTGIRGTPLYSAPEQLDGRPSAASDQYALACVAYYLLTGRPIFTGSLAEICHQHMNVPPLPPTSLNPALPAALDATLLRALMKRPEERYPHALTFAQALRAALDPPQPSASTTPTPPAPTAWAPPPTRRESPAARLAQVDRSPAPSAPPLVRPVSVLAESADLAEATTQSDGAPGVIAGRRAAPSLPLRLLGRQLAPSASTPPAAPSAAPTSPPVALPSEESAAAITTPDGARPDGPAGQLPFRRRRGKTRALLAALTPSRTLRRSAQSVERESMRSGVARKVALSALVALIALSALGGAGWALTHRATIQTPTHVGAITALGTVSLAFASGATQAPTSALAPVGPAAQLSGALVSPSGALSQYAALPALDLPASAPATTTQPLATGLGAQGAVGDHPWQTTIDSDGQTTVIVADDTLDVFHVTALGALTLAGAATARALFARALSPTDRLDQPRIAFDPTARRWALVMRQLSGSPTAPAGGALDLAISATSDALGAWRVFQMPATIPALTACAWPDDPRLGMNAASLTVTANLFVCGARVPYVGAGLWDLPRAMLLAGGPPSVYTFSGFADPAGKPVFGVAPAVQRGSDTTEWLLSDDAGYATGAHPSKQIILWALEHTTGATGAPTLVGLVAQSSVSYADPPSVAATVAGAQPLAIGDARPTQVIVSGGRLFAAFTTAARWSGDTLARPAVYWVIVALPIPAPGKPLTQRQLSSVSVADAGVWGAPDAEYLAPMLAVGATGALTLAAVRVASGQAPQISLATQPAGDGAFAPARTLATSASPLLWNGQGGVSFGGAQADTLWLVAITSAGASWRAEVWRTATP